MPKTYKIHPSIGIARLGDGDAFFLAPETPGGVSHEIAADGSENPVQKFKHDGRMKRQAVRFRVYEYDLDERGATRGVREITADEAEIVWHVELANRKAAADNFRDYPEPGKRNPGVAEERLVIAPTLPPISGRGQHQVESPAGKFMDVEVSLGELRTDGAGRLLVLSSKVFSSSPTQEPITNYANNAGWHDNTSDGPVTAE
ncbi:MAG TPA: LodA/GoxA family CTQ-dependent oxidase, partial [Pyrinomonadaceae bacterium]